MLGRVRVCWEQRGCDVCWGGVLGRVRVCRDWEGVRCAGEGEGVIVCWGR